MNVRDEVAAGRPAKARSLAREIGVSPSLIYDMIARGEIDAKRVGQRRLIISNEAARKLLDMEKAALAA